ncbi:hypothetical protein B0H13DRAFT_1920679 [Mycena leptocephala]|nr:hypothetical protein B0H13DRAFT_1920679 [Mycena leptocephala]
MSQYPSASKYLDEELYPCRARWAWAWISNVFTAGVRTTGRVEGENRINKAIGGPKKTFLQLFNGLNQRTEDQTAKDLIQVRQSSRRRHESNLGSLFAGPLKILRDHAGPFALQTCYKQMQESLFYLTEVVQRPKEVNSWTEYTLRLTQEPGFEWIPGEENQMLNLFNNDKAHVSLQWLIALTTKRHFLPPLLSHLDRCSKSPVHISHIRPRWLQNPDFAVESIAAVSQVRELGPQEFQLPTRTLRSAFASNPLDNTSHETTPPPRTQTIPARDVLHNVQAAIRPLIAGIQTREFTRSQN